jgi:hypothetical protein
MTIKLNDMKRYEAVRVKFLMSKVIRKRLMKWAGRLFCDETETAQFQVGKGCFSYSNFMLHLE